LSSSLIIRCDFAAAGKVKATISTARLEDVNDVFARMRNGQIEGRVVLDLTA
jgi:propanol-preferring alcohol dehydrogenase